MRSFIIKSCAILIVILVYFTVWRDVRGLVTQNTIIPQIEYAKENCNEYISYHENKSTSLLIYLYDDGINDYLTFPYTTPAGFFLLAGIICIILLNGHKIHYQLLAGFHLLFWILSTATLWLGLCYSVFFMNMTDIGIKYFTPFVTFLIILLMMSPKLTKAFELKKID